MRLLHNKFTIILYELKAYKYILVALAIFRYCLVQLKIMDMGRFVMGNAAVMVCSHGKFAEYAMESVEMIIGKQENFRTLSVDIGSALEDIFKEMEALASTLDISSGMIMLVDIYGGTPSNVGSAYCLTYENVLLYSGFNMPVLLEIFLNRDKPLKEMDILIEEAYRNGFTNISKTLREN